MNIARVALVVLIHLAVCLQAFGREPDGQSIGWAWALVGAMQLYDDKPAPAPAPSGTCHNCNGTGKVGDGRVSTTCKDCNGTGVIKSAPAQEDKQKSLIMYSRSGCIHCERFKAGVLPVLKGWEFKEAVDLVNPVPHFEIRIGTRKILHDGYLSKDQLEQIVALQ